VILIGEFPPIRIAAAVIRDQNGQVLLVRKRGTRFFMQPGGKLHDGESPAAALVRELCEELACTLLQAEFLGTFSAPAANEPARTVEPAAEIKEVAWVEPSGTGDLPLAPLTRDHVIPLVLSQASRLSSPFLHCRGLRRTDKRRDTDGGTMGRFRERLHASLARGLFQRRLVLLHRCFRLFP